MATDRSNTPDRNPDPITGAPGSHPTGAGIGAAAGGATGAGAAMAIGAATGSIAGPVGTAIGIIAGGIVGGLVGKGVGEKVDPTEDDTYWREQHKSRPYYKNDYDYDRDLSPAYRYGSAIGMHSGDDYDRPVGSTGAATPVSTGAAAASTTPATTPTSRAGFETHEADIRSGWDKVRGKSGLTYDQARDAIRDAYDRRLQLREERLNITKDRVQLGEANIRKEVVTEHRTVEVPVQHEELVIERRPASGQAAGSIGDSETIRVPLSEERVNVGKDTVVTEEVSVGKRAVAGTERVEADVRKETLSVADQTRTAAGTTTPKR